MCVVSHARNQAKPGEKAAEVTLAEQKVTPTPDSFASIARSENSPVHA